MTNMLMRIVLAAAALLAWSQAVAAQSPLQTFGARW
jgi:hypothetical protein